MKPIKFTIALAVTLFLFFISCKKKHTSPVLSPAVPSLIIGIYDTASNGTSYKRMVYNAHYLLDSMIPTGTGLYAPQYMTTINYIDNNNYYIAASGNVLGFMILHI